MIIRVTQEHISMGKARESRKCPLALAIRDAITWKAVVVVGTTTFSIGEMWYNLPDTARSFRNDFDNGLPVFPFEFEADI
jgi:hypothetical protein